MEPVRIGELAAEFRTPEGEGPFAGVIVLHEFWGLNDDIRRIADVFVDSGYAVVAPDLYSWTRARPLCIVRTATDIVRNGTATTERVEGVRAWLAARPEVDGARIGVVGFCMGAGLAILTAARSPLSAASVNYGDIPRDTSELANACPVVASYGARDKRLRGTPARLKELLTSFGIEHDIVQYPTAGHSFMNHGGPRAMDRGAFAYDEDAATDSWRRILGWFGTHLTDKEHA